MFGLIVLLLIAAYLAISVMVVKKTMIWAQSSGRSPRRWGWIAGLTMYLLVFWDLIPTVLLHQYLCATEQGLWIYKTVEEWQRENPGVVETLEWTNSAQPFDEPGIRRGYILNQRFVWKVISAQPVPFLPVRTTEHRIVDRANHELMAAYLSVGTGYGNMATGAEGSWKFWLNMPPCDRSSEEFAQYRRDIERQGEINDQPDRTL